MSAAGYAGNGVMPLPGDTVRFETARTHWVVEKVGRFLDGVTKCDLRQGDGSRVRRAVPGFRLKLVSRR